MASIAICSSIFSRCVLIALSLDYAQTRLADAAESVLAITTQSGLKLRSLVGGDPVKARANLILLAGGSRKLVISGQGEIKRLKNNFLVRSRNAFARAGYVTAVADAPLDRRGPEGLLGGFRASVDHAADLDKLASKLSQTNSKPVIVIGTSRGIVSAANIAARNPDSNIKAVVLTSSLVGKSKKKEHPCGTCRWTASPFQSFSSTTPTMDASSRGLRTCGVSPRNWKPADPRSTSSKSRAPRQSPIRAKPSPRMDFSGSRPA
jgi:pimeloyl-ACP methyl ester carboxylesterase